MDCYAFHHAWMNWWFQPVVTAICAAMPMLLAWRGVYPLISLVLPLAILWTTMFFTGAAVGSYFIWAMPIVLAWCWVHRPVEAC